jgi:hypothetical protein
MPNENPRPIDRIAGARPAHQPPGQRPPDVELPTWAAYLIIVFTCAHKPDQAPSGQRKPLLRRIRRRREARW